MGGVIRFGRRIDAAVLRLTPAYFAFVMATGIVSVAMRASGAAVLSTILSWIAGVGLAALIVLNIVRAIRHYPAMADDFLHSQRAFGFFTFVAAVCVVGVDLMGHGAPRPVPVSLLVVGTVALMVLNYTVPWTTVRSGKHHSRPIHHADGSWFIWTVACQAVAVLAASLERGSHTGRQVLALLAVLSWSVGAFLYCGIAIVLVIRLMSYRLKPSDVTAPYWVAMGATAITVVAGTRIAQMAAAPMVDATRGLIAATAVFFWAFGTWLVPPLILAGWWRHVRHHVPLRYSPDLWAIIFPLGMYAVGSQFLGEVDHLPLADEIGFWESWVALAAWAVTFAAMLVSIWQHTLSPRPAPARAVSSTLPVPSSSSVAIILSRRASEAYGSDGTMTPPPVEKRRGRHHKHATRPVGADRSATDTRATVAATPQDAATHIIYRSTGDGTGSSENGTDPASAPIRVTRIFNSSERHSPVGSGHGTANSAGGSSQWNVYGPDDDHPDPQAPRSSGGAPKHWWNN